MIEANELRIGNWLSHTNNNGTFNLQTQEVLIDGFSCLYDQGLWTIPYVESKGIPLTKEILLNCGFIQLYRSDSCVRLELIDQPEYEFKSNSFHSEFRLFFEGHCMAGINYLHQLQNLYFALTGKELEVKL